MAIYKQEKSGYWYIDFVDASGKRVRQSAGTKNKQQAQELHDQLKAQAWRVKNVGDKERHSWQEAVVRYLSEQSEKKSLVTDKFHLRWLDSYLSDKFLDEINKNMLDKLKSEKLKTGVTNATVNRVLSTVQKILNAAKKEWEWLDDVPSTKKLTEPENRVRWLTHFEAEKLLSELPPHLGAMARFSLATGLREKTVVTS